MTAERRTLELDTDTPFDLFRVRTGLVDPDPRPKRQQCFAVIWIEGGYGEHEIDFCRYPLSAHRIYVISPGQVHQWHDNAFQGRVLLFDPTLLAGEPGERVLFGSSLYAGTNAAPFVSVAHRSAGDLIALANLIEGEFHSDPVDRAVMRHLCSAFALALARAPAGRDGRLALLLRLIEENHVAQRSPDFYAKIIGLSAKRLSQITRHHLGRTVVQLVHDRLILKAQRELCVTDKDVQEVGLALGFDDPSYFTRFFRRETGQTPNDFRSTAQIASQPLLPFTQAI